MKIALFGNVYRKESLVQIKELLHILEEKEIEVIIDEPFYKFLQSEGVTSSTIKEKINQESEFIADFALSIGGDGTFLNTACRIGDKNIPILGINTGRLGFLADVSGDEIRPAIEELLNDEYFIEQRSVIQLKTETENSFKCQSFALNEIAVLKQDSSSMIAIDVYINNEFLSTYQADGLILATPTGSTAYSLSVGGPLLVPQTNNLILSPVAPHSLHIRPLVIPDTWTVCLEVKSRTNSFLVSLDGRAEVFEQPCKLTISKAGHTIKVVKRIQHTFFNALRNKLLWGVDKRS